MILIAPTKSFSNKIIHSSLFIPGSNNTPVDSDDLSAYPTSFFTCKEADNVCISDGVPSRPKDDICASRFFCSSVLPTLKSSVSVGPGDTGYFASVIIKEKLGHKAYHGCQNWCKHWYPITEHYFLI